jgi:hypothetical protein
MNQSSADVTLRSGRTFDADSAYLRDDHLTVWEDGISHDVLRDSLARISVHTIGAGIGSGMGTGFLTGAAFGVMMGVATGSSIIVPELESEDATAVVFYWNGKLEWLPKARITMEEVPEGVKISMPQSLRGTLK